MDREYLEVPVDILTGKDINYLSDIFQWNYNALKSTYNALNNINDEEIASICEDAVALFDDNINDVLDILSELGGNDDE